MTRSTSGLFYDSGEIVKAFDDLSGFSVSASPTTEEISTDYTLFSSASLHLVTAIGATTEVSFTGLTYDFKHRMFGWWVYVIDHTKISSLLSYVGTTGYAVFATSNYDMSGVVQFQRNGWHFLGWGQGQWSSDIGESLQQAKLRIVPEAGEQAEIYIDTAWTGMRSRPRLVFLFDDGDESQYTYRSIMNDRNISAGYGYIREVVGNTNKMTRAQLDTMYADGHDMVIHGGTSYTSFDETGLRNEIVEAQADLLANNYDRGVRFLIYPFGDLNKSIIDIVRGYFGAARSTLSPTHGNWGFGVYPIAEDPSMHFAGPVVGWTNNSTVSEMKAQIDSLIKVGQDGFTMMHDIVASGATGIDMNEADLAEVADHAILRQSQGLLTIVSPSEYLAGISRTSASTARTAI